MVKVSSESITSTPEPSNSTSTSGTSVKSHLNKHSIDNNMAGVPLTPNPSGGTSSSGTSSGNAAVAIVAPTSRTMPQPQQQQQQQIVPPHTIVPPSVATKNTIPNMKIQHQPQQTAQSNAIYVTTSRPYPPQSHQHLHTIGPTSTGTAPPWPIVDPVFHFGPGFERQHYCPTHSQGPQPHEHVVFFHVNPGVSVSFQISGNREVIRGPITVPMVSQGGSPPIAMPVQVPAGHVMQQIVDENGTLRHVILSTAQHQQMHGQSGVQGIQSHIQGHYIAANNAQPHFYSPLSTGLPGPGAGPPHYHTIPSNHLHQPPLQHSLHSPSPPNNNYHKDERTQRQHTKLLRKLDQKHREINSSPQMQPTSMLPRKSESNGVRRSDQTPTNGTSGTAVTLSTTTTTSSGSTASYEDREELSSIADDEDDVQSIIDQLSSVQSPQVSDLTPRTALLQWTAPSPSENVVLNSRDLRYEVLLSDRGKEGKYKIIFKGHSLSCRILDLRPGQEYSVCLQVYLEEIQGSASDAAIFTTPSCEPDQPLPPKLIARTKNSLQLRWNAPSDNGAHIQQYILEYDEGKGKEFVEIIKIKGKQYSLSKLQPSMWYSFRLAAVNECGKSVYSDIITYSTSGNPPIQLLPPILQGSTSCSLRIAWHRRAQEEEFVLQVADGESGHGFLTCYSGRDILYECMNLKRATGYQFRIRAENEAGSSPWSEIVTFLTQPERPGRPQKLHVKGKIHATHFKAKWEPPTDRGGAEIKIYNLQISHGTGYETIFTGNDTEAVCDHLQPGTTYQIRISCEGPGGVSMFSEPCSVTTDAVVPGQPMPPVFGSTPGPYAAVLRWELPEYNGGAPITEHELKIDSVNGTLKSCIVYKGKDTLCVAKDLSPGERYEVQVRAFNRIGASTWSDSYAFTAGAAAPFAPDMPELAIQSSSQITITWKEPFSNGAPITEYQLLSAYVTTESDEVDVAQQPEECFNICYQGISNSAELKQLLPFTTYSFKVCAKNSAGTSLYSSVASIRTPAATPCAPTIDSFTVKSTEFTISWKHPDDNGAAILYYKIDCTDCLQMATEIPVTEYTVKNLSPETSYKCKVQAVNEIGAGPFSHAQRITTNPLPPKPPKLECTGSGHNFLKLKWADGKNIDFTRFYLQMFNARSREYYPIYDGKLMTFKVNKLQEQTTYMFRICSESDHAGKGDFSDEYAFRTTATLPSSIKPPKCIDQDGHLLLEWQYSRNVFADPVEYILQLQTLKEQDFKQVYRGRDNHYKLDELEADLEYVFRVCPVRVTQANGDLFGPYTATVRHKVTLASLSVSSGVSGSVMLNHMNSVDAIDGATASNASTLSLTSSSLSKGAISKLSGKLATMYSSRKKLTDRDKAIMYAILFICASMAFAACIQMFIVR